ncbi:MAG: GxxExxY protein [Verrucomicrobia bacterium]|nr:GxxExxY protein [Verrucomicrobiota bacterium]
MNTTTNPSPSELNIFKLCDRVRETSFALHKFLRHGHAEKVYQNGLLHLLRKQGVATEAEVALKVFDEDGTRLGEFFADLVVLGRLLIELKAIKELTDEHVAQVLGYMRASRIEHALLINFGGSRLEVRKYILNDAFRAQDGSALKRSRGLLSLFAPLCAFLWP